MRKFILELAGNQNQEFGRKISEFITEMRSRSSEAHQKMLLEVSVCCVDIILIYCDR